MHKLKWPASEVKMVAIASVIPYAKNARTHSDAQVAQIAASIKEWGWTVPILIDEGGGLIAGHGRVLAARQLGITEIPALTAEGWSEEKKRAYILADNKLALNAGWDNDLLVSELRDLQELGFDLELTGFTEDELANLLVEPTDGLTDEDETPEASEDAITVLGDIWQLGNHRICCGDSTNAENVAALLSGVKPHLMVTDPPYGVEYDAEWRNKVQRSNGKWIGATAVGEVLNDDVADWSEAWVLFPGNVAYVWHAGIFTATVATSLEKAGFSLRSQIIWAKNNFAISRGHYHWQHEPCWYAVKKESAWKGDRKQTTLWQIPKPQKSETGHSTQKPVECMRRPIENNSSPGQAVYEPFSGSGTTIIAAEQTGRHAYAMELNPAYVDVAVIRWQNFTGKQAVHAVTGQPFPKGPDHARQETKADRN